ncbi:MAG: hypothetical protein PVF73_00485 [Bacteroidales bacterium]|jgi:hypothetical protein
MKRIFVFLAALVITAGTFAQGDLDNSFYFRFGYSKPTKSYGGVDNDNLWDDIKRNGFLFEIGHLFYFNSLDMADGLRLGLNADYANFTFHSLKNENFDDSQTSFFLFGSKIGPVLSYSPVDKLVFDAFIKFNPVWVSAAVDSYGDEGDLYLGFVGVGFSTGINIRYSILMLGFDFSNSWNKLQYYDDDDGFDGEYLGNYSDSSTDYSPLPSFNLTIGLAF